MNEALVVSIENRTLSESRLLSILLSWHCRHRGDERLLNPNPNMADDMGHSDKTKSHHCGGCYHFVFFSFLHYNIDIYTILFYHKIIP